MSECRAGRRGGTVGSFGVSGETSAARAIRSGCRARCAGEERGQVTWPPAADRQSLSLASADLHLHTMGRAPPHPAAAPSYDETQGHPCHRRSRATRGPVDALEDFAGGFGRPMLVGEMMTARVVWDIEGLGVS